MKKALAYYRVSTEEQAKEGVSLEAQQIACRKWCKDNDYIIVKEYRDEGKSATTLKRPALQDLLIEVEENIEIEAVVLLDTDRLARNTLDHLTIKAILKDNKVQLVAVNQPLLDDSPEGNLIDTIIASVNAFQSQITARKTKRTLEAKAKVGWLPGLPPLGYKNDANPNPNSTLDKRIVVKDPKSYKYVKRMLIKYAQGDSTVVEMTKYLNDKGIKPLRGVSINKSTVWNILQNPFYTGVFYWDKKEYQGKHPKMITTTTFTRIQNRLKSYDKARKYINHYLLAGYLFDKNNKRLGGEFHKKKNGKTYKFYSLHSESMYLRCSKIEKRVEKLFEKIEISDEYVTYVMDLAKKLLKEHRENRDTDRTTYLQERVRLERAMHELEDSRFIHKEIDNTQFTQIYKRYEEQLDTIDKNLEILKKDYSQNLKNLERILYLAEDIGNAYKEADFDLKRRYIGLFFNKFIIDKKGIVSYELNKGVKEMITQGSVRVTSQWGRQWDDTRTKVFVKEYLFV